MTPTKNPNVMNILNGYSAKKMACMDETNEKASESDDAEEKFIAPPMDLFGDLFEHGKISEMLLNKKVTFAPAYPSGNFVHNEHNRLLLSLSSFDEHDWSKQLNKWKESLVEDNKFESADLRQEMPNIDDLVFKLPDNFDLF